MNNLKTGDMNELGKFCPLVWKTIKINVTLASKLRKSESATKNHPFYLKMVMGLEKRAAHFCQKIEKWTPSPLRLS